MIFNDQDDVIKALSTPSTYGSHIDKVSVIQSPIAILFFAGDLVYKLKRSVMYPGIDFSTPEKRKLACISEMKRSTIYAPYLIVGVKPIKRLKNGKIRIGGKLGQEVDSVLIEKRIPTKDILSNLLPSPSFDRFEAMDLAEQIYELHSKAKPFHKKWGVEAVKNIILENEQDLKKYPDLFDTKKVDQMTLACLDLLDKNQRLITFRQKSGRVKKCHGDLLLSNIAFIKKQFLFFSPIEYNEFLDTIDTLYDLSFLTMDFETKNLRRLSNIFLNHYMAYMNDISGLPLLPLYQSMHAAARAAEMAKASTFLKGAGREKALKLAKIYFDLIREFIVPGKAVLIACGGLSGSGKSRVAREIGGLMTPAPGAIILRDDVIKKQITGLAPHQRFNKTDDSPAFEKVVYDVLHRQAETALNTGSCVIVDALFYDEKQRKSFEKLAQKMHVPFIGLWMDAPLSVRTQRVKQRKRNPSDIRKEQELESQLSLETGPITWHKINTNGSREQTINKVTDVLKKFVTLK